MTKLKRPICVISAITIIFLLFISLPVPAVSAADNPIWPSPGSVDLRKTATALSDDAYSFLITLEIDGKDKNTRAGGDAAAASVVLVFDQSGSMAGVKLEKAKEAANTLLDILQPNSSSKISVALVAYGTSVTTTTEFSDFSKKDDLKSTINRLGTTGSTGTQAAIKKARDMLKERTGEKYMIVLSDGEPNYAYASTAKTDCDKLINVTGATYNFGYLYTSFNYTTNRAVSESEGTISAISEAFIARDADIEIFSVALGTSTVGANQKYGMLNIADDADHYMEASTADKLKEIFANIGEKIAYAAENGNVVDELASIPGYSEFIAFEYNPSLGAAKVSQGTVTFNSSTNTFTWDVGTITEGKTAKLEYYVTTSAKLHEFIGDLTINPEVTVFATNEKAVFDYTNVNGEAASKDFPTPLVVLPNTRGLMYARFVEVDRDGKLIGSDGLPLDEQDKPWLANSVRSEMQIKNSFDNDLDGTWLFKVGETYNIGLPTNHGITGYELYGNSSITVEVEDSQTYVYFTFVKTVVPNTRTCDITFEIDSEYAYFEESVIEELSGAAIQSTGLAKRTKAVSHTYDYGDKIVVPTVVCESGYEFKGWTPSVAETATETVKYVAVIQKIVVNTDNKTGTDTPKTGDETNIALPAISILCAGIVAAVALKKKKHENA